MPVERHRLLELALQRLRSEQVRISSEITAIEAELKGTSRREKAERALSPKRRRPKLSAAERKRRSQAMKDYWAKRKQAEKASRK
jgi:hypothetical protein